MFELRQPTTEGCLRQKLNKIQHSCLSHYNFVCLECIDSCSLFVVCIYYEDWPLVIGWWSCYCKRKTVVGLTSLENLGYCNYILTEYVNIDVWFQNIKCKASGFVSYLNVALNELQLAQSSINRNICCAKKKIPRFRLKLIVRCDIASVLLRQTKINRFLALWPWTILSHNGYLLQFLLIRIFHHAIKFQCNTTIQSTVQLSRNYCTCKPSYFEKVGPSISLGLH